MALRVKGLRSCEDLDDRVSMVSIVPLCAQVLPAGDSGESFEVQARGELQLGLLMGKCRREPLRTAARSSMKVEQPQTSSGAMKEVVCLLCREHAEGGVRICSVPAKGGLQASSLAIYTSTVDPNMCALRIAAIAARYPLAH